MWEMKGWMNHIDFPLQKNHSLVSSLLHVFAVYLCVPMCARVCLYVRTVLACACLCLLITLTYV